MSSSAPPPTTPVHVALLPRSYFAAKDTLISALISPSPSSSSSNPRSPSLPFISDSLSPSHLLYAPSAALYPLLTLILCAIDAHSITSAKFLSLARAVRDRCAVHRVLKLRLLTMLDHASFPTWHLQTIVRRSAYSTSRVRLRAALSDMSLHEGQREESRGKFPFNYKTGEGNLQRSYNVSRAFCEYVAKIVFAPSKVEYWALHTEGGDVTFSTKGLTSAVRNTPGVVNNEHADLIVTKLIYYKLATPTTMPTSDEEIGSNHNNAKHCHHQQFYDKKSSSSRDVLSLRTSFAHAFTDGEAVHVRTNSRTSDKHSRSTSPASTSNPASNSNATPPQSIVLVMPVDRIDLQSLDFWNKHIYDKNAEKGMDFGIRSVVHPLLIGSVERDGDMNSNDQIPIEKMSESKAERTQDENLIDKVVVTKVFSSLTRPCMAELKRFTEGADSNMADQQTTVRPSLLIKKGDNLMQDHCVGVMFQVFNFVWRHSDAYRSASAVPHCFSYEVVPSSVTMGYIEGVSNVTSLGEVDWKSWYARHAGESSGRTIENLIHSAAGAFVGGYVLGATDRHWGNMVLKDDTTLLHIDFSFILGDAPPIDAPRISVPPAMEKLFKGIQSSSPSKSHSLWDTFVEATVSAFLTLRRDVQYVLYAADMLFTHAGFDREKVQAFLTGKSGFALNKSEKDAGEYLRKKILQSSGHWKTHFKKFVHDVVNPAWYAMVQKGPVPAEGVMKMINRYQAESPSTVKLTEQQEVKNESSLATVNIGE